MTTNSASLRLTAHQEQELTYLLSLLDGAGLHDQDDIAQPLWWESHTGDAETVDLLLTDDDGRWRALAQARAEVGSLSSAVVSREAVVRLARYTVLILNKASDLMIALGPLLPNAGNVWQQEVVRTAFRLAWSLR